MTLAIQKASFFERDYCNQFAWYWEQAGERIAWRFHETLDATILQLAREPGVGRLRRFAHPKLHGLQSFPVNRPFNKLIIFYRVEGKTLRLVRLMHGARDLPRRLAEPPA
ncbi:MAG: type II toxin-antitoxin system RelE/ParE family toxin [Verrucomicrobiota bacterium]